MNKTFTIDDKSYAEEDMNEDQKRLFNTILNVQHEIGSVKLKFDSYDTYAKVLSQQLAHSLTSKSADEPSETQIQSQLEYISQWLRRQISRCSSSIVEAKGQFDSEDRHKHKCVRRQHPELDIRFVFSNAKAKLYKGSKSTYSDWCNKNKFLWSNKTIPDAWLNEPGKCTTKRLIQLKQKRKKQI